MLRTSRRPESKSAISVERTGNEKYDSTRGARAPSTNEALPDVTATRCSNAILVKRRFFISNGHDILVRSCHDAATPAIASKLSNSHILYLPHAAARRGSTPRLPILQQLLTIFQVSAARRSSTTRQCNSKRQQCVFHMRMTIHGILPRCGSTTRQRHASMQLSNKQPFKSTSTRQHDAAARRRRTTPQHTTWQHDAAMQFHSKRQQCFTCTCINHGSTTRQHDAAARRSSTTRQCNSAAKSFPNAQVDAILPQRGSTTRQHDAAMQLSSKQPFTCIY